MASEHFLCQVKAIQEQLNFKIQNSDQHGLTFQEKLLLNVFLYILVCLYWYFVARSLISKLTKNMIQPESAAAEKGRNLPRRF